VARADRLEAAVTAGGADRHELDQAARAERASVRRRAARHAAPVGGSNRLLSVEELAAYLGVPKKTVYGCWRDWGLRGYRVGRYLRFRERHVEEWLQSREV
jgi:excisionase family DNA binding protein